MSESCIFARGGQSGSVERKGWTPQKEGGFQGEEGEQAKRTSRRSRRKRNRVSRRKSSPKDLQIWPNLKRERRLRAHS